MSEVVIKVDNLSKLYRLGAVGRKSLKADLKRWWVTQVKKEDDPFMKIGEENVRNKKSTNDYVWSLKDINFEVKRGEALGIIGTNGSGKSTMLKILSRVTAPTTGEVKIKGRIASLLEVGTGFHGELSGRQNIFLNGSIMGMTRHEIRSKFDEIVNFSGVERYIDTPVKRYSSGMYVRLAFAVAAHLEPDILIVDEVLAVGDIEFQKKCLGKMHDASEKEGRTVIFVSHNMSAVQELCTRAILLNNGVMEDDATPDKIIKKYLRKVAQNLLEQSWPTIEDAPGNDFIRMKSIKLIPQLAQADDPVDVRTPLKFEYKFWNLVPDTTINVVMVLNTISGDCVFTISTPQTVLKKGLAEGECIIPGNLLNDGKYTISLYIDKNVNTNLYTVSEGIVFEVEHYKTIIEWYSKWEGVIRPNIPFSLKPSDQLYN